MKNTMTIASREFRSYLTSPMAYVVTGIFLVLTGFFFGMSPSTYYETSIRGFLDTGSLLLLLIVSVFAMRLLAEERKLGTLELLLTSPVRDSEVIIGKFLGGLGIMVAMLALTLYYPLVLIAFGDPDLGPIVAGYIGLFLLGGACLAVGVFASSLTANQIVAAVVSGGILFALWFAGSAGQVLPAAFGQVFSYISLSYYFPDFITGIIDTRGIVYYLSVMVIFLFLAIRSLENSRWS